MRATCAGRRRVDGWDGPRVYNYFQFHVGTDADAEDLTAFTFERAWRAHERYRPDPYAGSRALYLYINRRRVPFFLVGELIAPYYGPDSAIVAPTSPDFRETVREMMAP